MLEQPISTWSVSKDHQDLLAREIVDGLNTESLTPLCRLAICRALANACTTALETLATEARDYTLEHSDTFPTAQEGKNYRENGLVFRMKTDNEFPYGNYDIEETEYREDGTPIRHRLWQEATNRERDYRNLTKLAHKEVNLIEEKIRLQHPKMLPTVCRQTIMFIGTETEVDNRNGIAD